MILKKERSDSK